MASLNDCALMNVEELKQDPVSALNAYCSMVSQTRWRMDLHKSLIERMKTRFSTPSEAADSEAFLTDLYDILKAWYGNRSRWLIDFGGFKIAVKHAAAQLDSLKGLRVESVGPTHVGCINDTLWRVIQTLIITRGKARIVSGTKAIHHLVPDLIPPMDVRYTGRFFWKLSEIGQAARQQAVFRLIFRASYDLAQCVSTNSAFMACVGTGFHTSLPKALDNAIIGLVDRKLGEKPITCR